MRASKEAPFLWVSLALIAISAAGVLRLETRNSLGAQFFDGDTKTPVIAALVAAAVGIGFKFVLM